LFFAYLFQTTWCFQKNGLTSCLVIIVVVPHSLLPNFWCLHINVIFCFCLLVWFFRIIPLYCSPSILLWADVCFLIVVVLDFLIIFLFSSLNSHFLILCYPFLFDLLFSEAGTCQLLCKVMLESSYWFILDIVPWLWFHNLFVSCDEIFVISWSVDISLFVFLGFMIRCWMPLSFISDDMLVALWLWWHYDQSLP
jgi:hypothetical protein